MCGEFTDVLQCSGLCPAIANDRSTQHRYTEQSLGKELKQPPIIPYLLKSVSTLVSRDTAAMGPSGAASSGRECSKCGALCSMAPWYITG